MASFKRLAVFSEDAIVQAMRRVGVDSGELDTILKPVIIALESEQNHAKKTRKKPNRPTLLSADQIFVQHVVPQIRQKLAEHEQKMLSGNVSWNINLRFDTKFSTMTVDQLKQSHATIVHQETTVENIGLLMKYWRGSLYREFYGRKPKDANYYEVFRNEFGIAYETARRYIAFESLITRWPLLLVCDLSFEQLLKHNKRLVDYISQDDDLNAKLSQSFGGDILGCKTTINPAEVEVLYMKDSSQESSSFDDQISELTVAIDRL